MAWRCERSSAHMGRSVVEDGAHPSGPEHKAWGLEAIQRVLGFGGGTAARQPPPGAPAVQLAVLEHKLSTLSNSPRCFDRAHPDFAQLVIDLQRPCDRAAALEVTQRLPGVSRWKPNLVPRVVKTEAIFYANFLSWCAATAHEHFSDESNVEFSCRQDEISAAAGAGAGKGVELELQPVSAARPAVAAVQVPGRYAARTSGTAAVSAVPLGAAAESAAESAAAPVPAPAAAQTLASVAPPALELQRFQGPFLPAGARASLSAEQAFLDKRIVFWIGKSDNTNTVVYEATLDGGSLRTVHPYWILYARSPVVEEELTLIERNTAYGSSCTPDASHPGRFVVVLAALKERPIQVWAEPGAPRARPTLHALATIDGQPDELLSVFVKTTTSWGLPTVEYVDIVGRTRKERIAKA